METSFAFDGDAPAHIEAHPRIATYLGLYGLFGVAMGNKPYTLAVDVPTEETVRVLATARAKKQEETIEQYGYTDDVYVLFPDGQNERTYYGRERDED